MVDITSSVSSITYVVGYTIQYIFITLVVANTSGVNILLHLSLLLHLM